MGTNNYILSCLYWSSVLYSCHLYLLGRLISVDCTGLLLFCHFLTGQRTQNDHTYHFHACIICEVYVHGTWVHDLVLWRCAGVFWHVFMCICLCPCYVNVHVWDRFSWWEIIHVLNCCDWNLFTKGYFNRLSLC